MASANTPAPNGTWVSKGREIPGSGYGDATLVLDVEDDDEKEDDDEEAEEEEEDDEDAFDTVEAFGLLVVVLGVVDVVEDVAGDVDDDVVEYVPSLLIIIPICWAIVKIF